MYKLYFIGKKENDNDKDSLIFIDFLKEENDIIIMIKNFVTNRYKTDPFFVNKSEQEIKSDPNMKNGYYVTNKYRLYHKTILIYEPGYFTTSYEYTFDKIGKFCIFKNDVKKMDTFNDDFIRFIYGYCQTKGNNKKEPVIAEISNHISNLLFDEKMLTANELDKISFVIWSSLCNLFSRNTNTAAYHNIIN